MGAEHRGELRERRTGAQEVRSHRQDDRHAAPRRGRRVQEVGEEHGPDLLEPLPRLVVLRPVGEDLLELVHHHDQPHVLRPVVQGHLREDVEGPLVGAEVVGQLQDLRGVGEGAGRQEPRHDAGRQVLQRVVPRPDDRDRPVFAPLDRPGLQPRHQPGQHHRRLAAAGGPQHAQEPHPLRPPHLAPQGADQPARQALAAEEELRVVGPERLQAAIRADPLVPRLVRRRRLLPRDPPFQAAKDPLVIERLEELDPGGVDEELQVRHVPPPGPLGAGQQHGDDVERLVACPLVDGDLELLLLPGPQAVGPQEHHAGLAVAQPLGQRRLELAAGSQLRLIQVQLQPLAPEPLGDLMDGLAVQGVVRQERIVALRSGGRHGGTCSAD